MIINGAGEELFRVVGNSYLDMSNHTSNQQLDGVGIINISAEGKVKYISCGRLYKYKEGYDSYKRMASFNYKYEQFYVDLDNIADSLYQTISFGKLLGKMCFIYNIPNYRESELYYTYYDTLKERESGIGASGKIYYQQVIPFYIQEKIVNELSCAFNKILDGEIKIVEGEELRKYYWRRYYWRSCSSEELEQIKELDWDDDNFYHGTNSNSLSIWMDKGLKGGLEGSCMRYGGCQSYLDIYALNPDKVKMAVYLKDELLIARCIVWYKDNHKYSDRIYAVDSLKEIQMKEWLNLQGFKDIFNCRDTFDIRLNKGWFEEFPYMDTLKYLDGDGLLSNYEPEDTTYYKLQNTNGENEEFIYEEEYEYAEDED